MRGEREKVKEGKTAFNLFIYYYYYVPGDGCGYILCAAAAVCIVSLKLDEYGRLSCGGCAVAVLCVQRNDDGAGWMAGSLPACLPALPVDSSCCFMLYLYACHRHRFNGIGSM